MTVFAVLTKIVVFLVSTVEPLKIMVFTVLKSLLSASQTWKIMVFHVILLNLPLFRGFLDSRLAWSDVHFD